MALKINKTNVVFTALFAACVTQPYWAHDETTAREKLATVGLTPTKIGATSYTDYPFFTCLGSTYSTKFAAASANGKVVTGTFCNGPFLKGKSIEIDLP